MVKFWLIFMEVKGSTTYIYLHPMDYDKLG
jgi:hypothetical protein